jgi:GNAT superfamily N-acetyltransferase
MSSGGPRKLRRGHKPVREVVYCARTRLPARGRSLAPRYGEAVSALEIAPVTAAELERVLPLIGDYQRFYEVDQVDEERNRAFFRRFLAPSEDGLLLGARQGAELVGFACLYWHFSSLAAAETVLMNDLFVSEAARGHGTGRALIEASAAVARERGAASLEWATAPGNVVAQRLYDSTGAERSEWVEYELGL